MLLALVLTAVPVELRVDSAALLAPTTNQPVGALSSVRVTAESWTSPTVFLARHESAAIEVTARVDLSREGTYVEAVAAQDVTLTGTGAWLVVLKKGAQVPLVGHVPEGLRVGFKREHFAVTPYATIPDVTRPVPPAEGPDEECLVTTMYARAEPDAPSWKLASFATTVHRGTSVGGWSPAWAEGLSTIVHGFVRVADVVCGVGSGGGLGLSGIGTGSGDGMVEAQAATLPQGTRLFASEKDTVPLATLKTKAEGLKLKDGTWRINSVRSGSGWVRFSNVYLGKDARVTLGPLGTHGVGSSIAHHDGWPRFKK